VNPPAHVRIKAANLLKRRSSTEAQQFKRDPVRTWTRSQFVHTPDFAREIAIPVFRGGGTISPASIRAAEAIAPAMGKLWRAASRAFARTDSEGVPFSEVEAFCTDLERSTSKRLQFIVKHWRDTKKGGYQLKEERDIYELIGIRRSAACGLASCRRFRAM